MERVLTHLHLMDFMKILWRYINQLLKFDTWFQQIHIFWDSLQEENFLRFKDAKESIECIFRKHSGALQKFLNKSVLQIRQKQKRI